MRTILHCDLNNFYASVECLYHPQIRGNPVAVCGDPELRHGIVLAKNDLAKAAGVQTGDAIWQAKQKCPGLICVPPHYDRYLQYSRMAREIYGQYTDRVEPFGLDECWLDLTGCEHLFGSGEAVAHQLRQRIREELGVTASIGVSFCKIFAKLGSDMKKPDATTVIPYGAYRQIVWPLPVGDLLYVGRATKQKLLRYSIQTIGDLAQVDAEFLRARLGKMGLMLWAWANGHDTAPVLPSHQGYDMKSIGNSTTAPRDLVTEEEVKIPLRALCESVAYRLRQHELQCTTVQISLRDTSLLSFQRQVKVEPTCLSEDILTAALDLYRRHKPAQPLRSIGVKGSGLVPADCQLSLFDKATPLALERTLDALRRRYGNKSVQRGNMLLDPALAAVDPAEHVIFPISYFR